MEPRKAGTLERNNRRALALLVIASSFQLSSSFSPIVGASSLPSGLQTPSRTAPAARFGMRSISIPSSRRLHVASLDHEEAADSATTPKTALTITSRGKFHRAIYDKPIVLLGCSSSGSNDELSRLATSLSSKLSHTGERAVIEAVGGTDAQTIHDRIECGELTRSNVIVLDFDQSNDDEKMIDLARSLYEDEGLLSVYVNVQPEEELIGTSPSGDAKTRKEMERDVFVKFTDYEIVVGDEGSRCSSESTSDDAAAAEGGGIAAWEGIEWELERLIARATLPPSVPGSSDITLEGTAELTMGKNTFFLSLSFPKIEEVEPYLPAMCQDVDAMEFRADLLECRDDRFGLMRALQKLRIMCRPHSVRAPGLAAPGGRVIDDALPVVFTVRTAHQAGTYPDDEAGIDRMFDILELGLRSGVEVLDIESAWDAQRTDDLLTAAEERCASTLILGSHHVVPDEVTMEDAIGLYRQCHLGGRSHGAKVVLSIEDESTDSMADDAGRIAQSICRAEGQPVVPNIGLILGEVGQYSRVLNERFTPVTHESLPFVAAPGQLTAAELMKARTVMGHVVPKKYAILGHNIAYSVSPQMHNSAFEATKLPHSYGRMDVESVEEFVTSDLWNDPNFGGCSVTIPHKQAIMSHLDEMSEAAQAIGAVNTVVVRDEKDFDGSLRRVVFGDNTDWRGIYNPLSRRLGLGGGNDDKDGSNERAGVALILGGGGTARAAAYAATELGLEKVYWNRTPEKAQTLAEAFGGTVIPDLSESSLGDTLARMDGEVRAVISTLPAGAKFELPDWLIEEGASAAVVGQRLVILDVNYKPYQTMLLTQAEDAGLDVVRGSEMLWEQGVGQFQLWTGRTAPYRVMKDVVLENCMPQAG